MVAAIRTPLDSEMKAAPTTAAAPMTAASPATTAAPTGMVASAAANLPEKRYTGMIVSADPKERTLTVKGTMFSKKEFILGDNCAYSFLYTMLINNDGDGSASNLRGGEKVAVTYQDADGVLIADRIEQQPMQCNGIVKRIDPDKHTLILRRSVFFGQLDIAADCITMLPHEKAGALADIHPGDRVIVMYETPDCRPTAWEITKTSPTSPAR